VKQNFHDVIL